MTESEAESSTLIRIAKQEEKARCKCSQRSKCWQECRDKVLGDSSAHLRILWHLGFRLDVMVIDERLLISPLSGLIKEIGEKHAPVFLYISWGPSSNATFTIIIIIIISNAFKEIAFLVPSTFLNLWSTNYVRNILNST